MRIADIQYPVFEPYKKPTLEIYVSGCNRKCINCCNVEIQDFNFGDKLDIQEKIHWLSQRSKLFECISIVGGDLLCQEEKDAKLFAQSIRVAFPDKDLWLFTGEDEITKIPKWCFDCFDVIKYGSYKEDLKREGFPASTNQKLWYRNIKNNT
jgi:anaerobic ribonucleoside-triphosphate reductase activating protein